jgi:hypothetical protein
MIAGFDEAEGITGYFNDPEIPRVRVHPVVSNGVAGGSPEGFQGHMSFDWKTYMTREHQEKQIQTKICGRNHRHRQERYYRTLLMP